MWPEGVEMYVSEDGGLSWVKKRRTDMTIPGYDRHFFAIDDTNGKFHGRVYVHEWTYIRSVERDGWGTIFEGMGLYHTDDHGATWSDVMRRTSASYDVRADLPGNCDFFSDGALACIFLQRAHDIVASDEGTPEPLGGLQAVRIMTTPPGGEVFSAATSITGPIKTLECPYLAIDRFTKEFKDRLYAVWSETQGTNKDIWSVYSDDHGHTWSKPVMVNDDRRDPDVPGGDHDLPQIAVNRQGVVGVMWYDHREDPKGKAYRPRFSASLDGGETFLPSVAVASEPYTMGKGEHWPALMIGGLPGWFPDEKKRLYPLDAMVGLFSSRGDTAGLDTDPSGAFWGLWIDNRTKHDQMWTAQIHVNGTPVKHGNRELADLEDVSPKTYLHFTNISFDDSHSAISLTAQVRNRSEQDIQGPFKGRLLAFKSDVGLPQAANAENGETGLGAIWKFELEGSDQVLHPGEASKPQKLVFRLLHPGALYKKEDGQMRTNPISFDLEMLGKTVQDPKGAK